MVLLKIKRYLICQILRKFTNTTFISLWNIDFRQSEIYSIKKHIEGHWREKDHGLHMGDIEVNSIEKPAAIWEDTYYTFIVIKMTAFTYKNMFYIMRDKRYDTGVDEVQQLK